MAFVAALFTVNRDAVGLMREGDHDLLLARVAWTSGHST
jgi:hypothetical protein